MKYKKVYLAFLIMLLPVQEASVLESVLKNLEDPNWATSYLEGSIRTDEMDEQVASQIVQRYILPKAGSIKSENITFLVNSASQKGYFSVVKNLLPHVHDTEKKTVKKDGIITPSLFMKFCIKFQEEPTSFTKQQTLVMTQAYIDNGFDLNYFNFGNCPVVIFSRHGHYKTVKALLESKKINQSTINDYLQYKIYKTQFTDQEQAKIEEIIQENYPSINQQPANTIPNTPSSNTKNAFLPSFKKGILVIISGSVIIFMIAKFFAKKKKGGKQSTH